MFSLSRLSSRSKNKDELSTNTTIATSAENKTRRKSLTNYIRQTLQVATVLDSSSSFNKIVKSPPPPRPRPPLVDTSQQVEQTNHYENDDHASDNCRQTEKIIYDRLHSNNESGTKLNSLHNNNNSSNQVFEPDPDYWDLPYNNNLNSFKCEYVNGSSIHNDEDEELIGKNRLNAAKSEESNSFHAAPGASVKKAISLAEVIVKSISTNSSNSSSAYSSSKNLAVVKQTQHEQHNNLLPVTKTFKKNINNSFSSNNSASSSMTSSTSNHNNNEEIIVQETVQIDVQQEQKSFRKILQSTPTCNSSESLPTINNVQAAAAAIDPSSSSSHYAEMKKIENYSSNIYSSLDDENKEAKFNYADDKKNVIMTTFQITGITIGNEEEENALAHINMNIPPPPPPPPPSFPPPPPPLCTNLAKFTTNVSTNTMAALNTETLMLAKQKLKTAAASLDDSITNTLIKPPLPPESSKHAVKLENGKNKKNEFLLQEIQNHRLYNTKKDYVLDFLDRNKTNTTLSNVITSNTNNNNNNNNTKTSMSTDPNGNLKFARSLSGTNMVLLTTNVEVKAAANTEEPEARLLPPPKQSVPIVASYERFPNARSRQKQLSKIQQPSQQTNRAQSNANINTSVSNLKQSQQSVEKSDSKSSSVENLNNNKKCIVIIKNKQENEHSKASNRLSNNLENVNIISTPKVVQRSSSAAPYQNLDSNKLKIRIVNKNINQKAINLGITNDRKVPLESQIDDVTTITTNGPLSSSSSSTSHCYDDSQQCLMNKKFKQLQPPEKFESELDRVFKVNSYILFVTSSIHKNPKILKCL
jgi:hypothetical protein